MAYRDYGVANARCIGTFGNFNTFIQAMSSSQAVSGAVFCPYAGTYTENFTLPANLTISALPGSQDSASVVVLGKITFSAAGTSTISNIQLKTNGDYCIEVTGANECHLVLENVDLLCANFTAINFSNTNPLSTITLRNCTSDTLTTGVALYTMSSPGSMQHLYCDYNNTAASSTASNNSNGQVIINDCGSNIAFSSSGSGGISANGTQINTLQVGLNLTGINAQGTGNGTIINCSITSGSASSIAVGPGVILGIADNTLASSAPQYAINGTGTINLTSINATNAISIQPTKNLNGTIVAANIYEYGLLEIASGGTVQIDTGATVQVQAGAILNLQSGAFIDVPLTGFLYGNGVNTPVSAVNAGIIIAWTDVTSATQTIAVNNGYLTDFGAGVTYTLPATASIGDTFIIVGKLGLATITPNANQQLLMGSVSGAVGATGTAVATNVGDSVTFVCTTSGASTIWRASSWVGNWTITT